MIQSLRDKGVTCYLSLMKSLVYLCIALIVVVSACTSTVEETKTTSGQVYMASQEMNISYVDSISVYGEDVTVFQMQPVDEPYYDTAYNASSLILSWSGTDSLNILSFPELEVHGYVNDSAGMKEVVIPEFNDRFIYHQRSDSLLLEQESGKISRTTFFHPLEQTKGNLPALPGTAWNLTNSDIEFISFTSEDSCVIKLKLAGNQEYKSIGAGVWSVKKIDGRSFINFYSSDPQFSVFQTHFAKSAGEDQIMTTYYVEGDSSNVPFSEKEVLWSKAAEIADPEPLGEWVSQNYPFATGDRVQVNDTLLDVSTMLTLNKDGSFKRIIR